MFFFLPSHYSHNAVFVNERETRPAVIYYLIYFNECFNMRGSLPVSTGLWKSARCFRMSQKPRIEEFRELTSKTIPAEHGTRPPRSFCLRRSLAVSKIGHRLSKIHACSLAGVADLCSVRRNTGILRSAMQ